MKFNPRSTSTIGSHKQFSFPPNHKKLNLLDLDDWNRGQGSSKFDTNNEQSEPLEYGILKRFDGLC